MANGIVGTTALARTTTEGHLLWSSGSLSRTTDEFAAALRGWASNAAAKWAELLDSKQYEWVDTWPKNDSSKVSISVGKDGDELVWFLSEHQPGVSADCLGKEHLFLSMVLDIAPAGIWMQNGKGKLSFVNRAFCEATGISEKDFLSVEHYKMLLPEQFVPMCLASDEKALASLEPTVTIQQLPMADGQIHDLEVYKAVRRDANGEPIAMVGVAIEATAKLADARSMRKARDTAESLSRAKSEFLQVISHEMLTPLNGILGFSQILSEEVSPDQKEMAQDILAAGEGLYLMITKILEYTEIESRTAEYSSAVFNFKEEVETLFHNVCKNKKNGVDYICDIPAYLDKPLSGNVAVLNKALSALVKNACDFTSRGEVLLKPYGTSTDKGVDVVFVVTDTGVGIPDSFMPDLFTPFKQAESGLSKSHEGLGLDLALSRRLVEHAGGDIKIESELGKGTVAYLKIHFDFFQA